MAGLRRISIGFKGGQVLVVRVAEEALAGLQAAVGSDGGWYDLETEDGTAKIDLVAVVYVQLDSSEPRVGFGS
jgi:hypothetical protein